MSNKNMSNDNAKTENKNGPLNVTSVVPKIR